MRASWKAPRPGLLRFRFRLLQRTEVVERVGRPAVDVARQLHLEAVIGGAFEQRGDVDLRQRRPENVPDIEPLPRFLRAVVRRIEADDHVGAVALRQHVAGAVAIEPVERRHHLLQRIATRLGVALKLPAQAQRLLRFQKELDVEGVAQRRRRVSQQSLEDDELPRTHVLGRFQNTAVVVVDRLENGLPVPQQRHMLLEDVDVVGGGIVGGDAQLTAPLARVLDVVVGADDQRPFRPQDVGEPERHRRFAGTRIADDTDRYRT